MKAVPRQCQLVLLIAVAARLTGKRKPRNLSQCPWQCDDKGHNQANDTKDDRARAVIGQGVHHHRESENVATHDENQEEKLSCA